MNYPCLKFLLPTLAVFVLLQSISSCSGESNVSDSDSTDASMYFEVVPSETSGITFKNALTETDTFNYLNFEYMYNGAGVAVGDIDNDGLSDIYFVGNQVSDKLYLNKGGMKFEDITEKALGEKPDKGWRTGVTMADVNADGFLDIYVSRSGLPGFGDLLENLLYINNGNQTFSERGEEFGVNIRQGTNQSAFFDMDNDGDLDLYVMNRPYSDDFGQFPGVDMLGFPASDVLLENVNGHFEDVSISAGIEDRGFGLGLAICDINEDGFQDVYVSNDYIEPDYMYINQQNKTFKNEILTRTNHTSNFGMGNDVADFNNDGLVDIVTLDMVSEDHITSKRTMGGMKPDQFWKSVNAGNQYEYMFNTLQLNNGNGTFSEIAQLSGISKTDWSWAPLFADFDNDGLKDLFVTNGFRKDVRDSDYAKYLQSRIKEVDKHEEILRGAKTVKTPNYFFKNSGDLKFTKVNTDWKMDRAVNTNGAAYADLDNDGDLDLVLNNMEETSFILENKLSAGNHYLRVRSDKNFDGAKVTLKVGEEIYYQEMHPTRGYLSSMEQCLHFGIGDNKKIDKLTVIFNDGKVYNLSHVEADQRIEVPYEDAAKPVALSPTKKDVFFSQTSTIDHIQQEFLIDDFQYEILLPHKMSQLGPFLSSGDADGDGLEDLYISGAQYNKGSLYVQKSDGRFALKPGPWEKEKDREELGSIFFDADKDKDMDLYVVSGSNEYNRQSEKYQDQLYINDGKGNFTNETKTRLPEMFTSEQRVISGDYDSDGDLDLFVGGRQTPGKYPFADRSYLLRNDKGVFTDATAESPDLWAPGMITQSIFDDFDGDKDLDLVCVGEWMPVSFFENDKGKFKNVTASYQLSNTVGWWMSIEKGDFNGDGKNDYIVGNIGENNKFHPSPEHPLEIYVQDFDKNGSFDIVLGEYQNGKCYPVRGRSCSSQQMPFIKEKFPTFNEFAVADLDDIYGQNQLDSALHYSATHFSSSIVLSGEKGYTVERLPVYAQLGPLNASLVMDVNGDGNLDVVSAGNNFVAEIETIRYDAGRGVVLIGDGKGGFKQLAPHQSGFFVNSDAKDMIRIKDRIFVSSNNDKLKSFVFNDGNQSDIP